MKYARVMDGLKSNAGRFSYKLDEVNVASKWNPLSLEPEKMGGFNFGTEDKILRWLHRGDTIYDVIIPDDAEVILCDEEKGIYRSNKIIVTNPRTITDEIVIDLYNKTTLSDKIIAECLVTLLWKNRKEISKYIIKDRVNLNNIDVILKEFIRYAGEDNLNSESGKELYEILKEIQSDLVISLFVDKEPYTKTLSKDKVINLTGESGSGKSFFSNKWKDDDSYIIIDTDIVFSEKEVDNKYINDLRKIILSTFDEELKSILISHFDDCYKIILEYFKNTNKTIVIDSAQYRNVKDVSILKGKIIIMRTSIEKCYERCIERWKYRNDNYSEEDLIQFKNRKLGIFKWYKSLNQFIEKVDKL